jgi:hypothetical protein
MAEFPSSSVADGVWSLKQQRRAALGGDWPSVIPPFSASFITSDYVLGPLTSTTFSSISIGAADSSRTVVVGVSFNAGGSSRTVSSATIGGVTASVISVAGSGFEGSAIIYADVPTGTTADISLTFSNTVNEAVAIGVYRLINVSNVADYTDTSGSTFTTSVTTPSTPSYIISALGVGGDATLVSWSNTTEQYSYIIGGSSRYHGGASVAASSAGTVNVSASTDSSFGILTTAVFS